MKAARVAGIGSVNAAATSEASGGLQTAPSAELERRHLRYLGGTPVVQYNSVRCSLIGRL